MTGWFLPREQWRSCETPGYEVSNQGRVKSLAKIVPNGAGGKPMQERILKPWKSNGYLYVGLGRNVKETVHRLVAKAFLEPDERRAHVNHKNGLRNDNRAQNLEWVTPSENHIHAYRVLGRKRWTPKQPAEASAA
jgi:hypothetical protein